MDPVTDGEKLQMTKSRLRGLYRQKKSLFRIAAGMVFHNLDYFFPEQNEDSSKKTNSFPPTVCKRLLEIMEEQHHQEQETDAFVKQKYHEDKGLMDEFYRRKRAFKNLLSESIETLDLKAIMSFCDKQCADNELLQLMQLIVKKSPKLTSLTLDDFPQTCVEEFREELEKLKELTKLDAELLTIGLPDLKELCGVKLEKLQHLVVDQIAFEWSDLKSVRDFKRSFSNLRVFQFGNEHNISNGRLTGTDITCMCLKLLPQIQVVRDYIEVPFIDPAGRMISELPWRASALLHMHTKPKKTGLHLAFPNVTHLMVDGRDGEYKKREINPMLRFRKIEGLNLYRFSSAPVIGRFLTSYGANLLTLSLSDDDGKVEIAFSAIFDSCPVLKELNLDLMYEVVDSHNPLKSFAKLEKLQWKPRESTRNICMSNIFSAPDLKEVEISGYAFDEDDVKLLSGRIAKGQTLRNLVSLKYNNANLGQDYKNYFPVAEFDPEADKKIRYFFALNGLFKNASAYLPNLTSLEVSYMFEFKDKYEHIIDDFDYSGSHRENLIQPREAFSMELLGDKSLVEFLGVFNREDFAFTWLKSKLN